MKRILVGTSGWVYDDWVGPFYPKGAKQERWIAHYAEAFPIVEVNATHYRFPEADRVAGMTERMVQAGLEHAVYKAPREITHEAVREHRLQDAIDRAGDLHRALAPAADADLLKGVLYQFDHETGPDPLLEVIGGVVDQAPPAPIFVEVRHAAFNEDRHHQALRRLIEPTGGAVTATDSPASTITRAPPAERAYFRFHGRNEETWFLEDPPGVHGSSRYDYDYTTAELQALADRVESARSSEVLVFFNNHAEGQAPRNAQAFMELLDIQPPKQRVSLDDFLA